MTWKRVVRFGGYGAFALGLASMACSSSDHSDEGRAYDAGAKDDDSSAPSGPVGTPAPATPGAALPPAGTSPTTPTVPPAGTTTPPSPSPDVASGSDGPGAGEGAGEDDGGGTNGPAGVTGVLTAGTWDDNRNFDFFTTYRKRMAQSPGVLPFREADFVAALGAFGEPAAEKETLDIAFVIDTTGSMGDEISYLQAEFIALSDSISDKYPNAEQRWSLVVYRDDGDEYVVRSFDFYEDRTTFQQKLAGEGAAGGGDFPEAPEEGLAAAAKLSWRDDEATARLAFWVADAPHHAENSSAMVSAVESLVDVGVHVYPVASSGVDELTELSMRSVAQLSGGRYLFLTNDSGIGGDHKEPTVPCYFVTKLDDAILRMVDIELTGEYREPTASELVRTGGNPQNGRCTLESGETVEVY